MPHKEQASLFVVSTPIGNLKDITGRALEVLHDVSLVLSENVGKTRNLLNHYGIETRVASYRESNARRVIPRVLKALGGGKSVALVAEAGTPGISDPGRKLVDAVYREGLRVVPVPGPSAAVAAVSAAGMSESRFVFEGFLPRRKSKRRKRLEELAGEERLLVFFEAPHRISACLSDMEELLGDRKCLVAREITKLHEELSRGRLGDLAREYSARKPVGEFVIVCEGVGGGAGGPAEEPDPAGLKEEARRFAAKGMKKSEAAKALAAKFGIDRRLAYSLLTGAGPGPEKGSRRK
jgi:16S rRNA (cytidine1402-2'-O)-methyltransferase